MFLVVLFDGEKKPEISSLTFKPPCFLQLRFADLRFHREMADVKLLAWHRLLGLILKDFFFGTRFEVELEKDLSEQQQLADIVVLEDTGSELPKPPPRELPDGMEFLKETNVISFKSLNEAFDRFALLELGAHGVALAKLHAKDDWKAYLDKKMTLFALTTRRPTTGTMAKLMKNTAKNDVFKVDLLGFRVIVIVLSKAPKSKRTGFGYAIWNLPYTLDDFVREHYPAELKEMPRKKRLEILAELPVNERLEGISAEERLEGISAEELRERLKALEKDKSDN